MNYRSQGRSRLLISILVVCGLFLVLSQKPDLLLAGLITMEAGSGNGSGNPILIAGIALAALTMVALYIGSRRESGTTVILEKHNYHDELQAANILLLTWGPHGQIIRLNPHAEKYFGYPDQSLIGRQLIDSIVPETDSSGRNLISLYRKLQTHPLNYPTHECEHVRSDGSKVWVLWTNKPVFSSEGKLVEILSIGQDITEQKRNERRLLLTASVFDYSVEGIMITDPKGRIIRVNRAFNDITGMHREEVSGRDAASINRCGENDSFHDEFWSTLNSNGSWQGEILCRPEGSDLRPTWLSMSCVKNKKDQITHYVGLLSDITDKKLSEQRIQKLAFFDELTELPNRVLFLNRLTHTMKKAARESLRVPVIYINLNRFKSINDSLGHDQGDRLLKQVASRLRSCVRGSDTIAHMGADEFTVIVEPVQSRDEVIRVGSRIAQSIVESMARPFDLNGYDAFMSVSLGIVSFPDDGLHPNELIRNAHTTVTHAGQRGPNNYLFYESRMNATAMKRMQMATDLHKALDNGEFVLYYQPTLNLHTGQINGCEALVRWQHPKMGMIMPLQFIPLAEETGLIVPLGEWVFAEAIRQTREWQNEGINPLRVAVNLSVYNLRAKDLLRFIGCMLSEIQLPAESVAIELTESVFMADMDDIKNVLHELDKTGIQLLIDDFGTGYSSLSRLKELPAHTLKIDRSFIQDIPENPDNASLVTAIIGMAHNLNMQVIAEGIETEEQLVYLMEQRCDEVQGYLISKPVPAGDFLRLITTSKHSPTVHTN